MEARHVAAPVPITPAGPYTPASQVELLPDGALKPVTHANVKEYVSMVLAARAGEARLQARAIRKGFNHVVPVGMLSLFSWCGAALLPGPLPMPVLRTLSLSQA